VRAHWSAAVAEIERYKSDPAKFAPAHEIATPPGQPIGSLEEDESW
jgi:hypothetical protein